MLARTTLRAGFAAQRRIAVRLVSAKVDDTPTTPLQQVLLADKAPSAPQIIHKVNMFLLGAAPVALATSPSVVSFPLDLVMGVAIPVHMHIGMNGVISDYVPKSAQTTARIVLLVVSGVTLLGLMKLNLAGDGISETAKALWRKPAAKEEGH